MSWFNHPFGLVGSLFGGGGSAGRNAYQASRAAGIAAGNPSSFGGAIGQSGQQPGQYHSQGGAPDWMGGMAYMGGNPGGNNQSQFPHWARLGDQYGQSSFNDHGQQGIRQGNHYGYGNASSYLGHDAEQDQPDKPAPWYSIGPWQPPAG